MTKEGFKLHIFNKIHPQYEINKPKSISRVLNISPIKGIKYSIGNDDSKKTITLSELEKAYDILVKNCFISYSIFRDNLKDKRKPCNLRTIMGLLLQLKLINEIEKNQFQSNIFK
ncbi:hypothetical protein ACNSOL_12205 (plasmid) [Aliarcobacter lanthieri]|uniref:hypothetical protein n=1 Tax=Aliarcobacter lanthieri TaxID=1355374 RepID=UPI003AAD533D